MIVIQHQGKIPHKAYLFCIRILPCNFYIDIVYYKYKFDTEQKGENVMQFFINNLVPLCMLGLGALFSAIMSLIRNRGKDKTTESECISELAHLIGKYLTLSSFIMLMFALSGSTIQTKVLQAGILLTVSIILSKIHCYYHINFLKKVETEYVDLEAVKNIHSEERLTPASFFMIMWMFITILETMSVFVCGFYGFENMTSVIAISMVIFVAEAFFGIAFVDLINQIIDKISAMKDGDENNSSRLP